MHHAFRTIRSPCIERGVNDGFVRKFGRGATNGKVLGEVDRRDRRVQQADNATADVFCIDIHDGPAGAVNTRRPAFYAVLRETRAKLPRDRDTRGRNFAHRISRSNARPSRPEPFQRDEPSLLAEGGGLG